MAIEILVCIKRVPDPGARVELAPGDKSIETRKLGFTISPHEECAVEAAVQLVEQLGGSIAVLTLGPAEAEEQLRDAMALGPDRGILLETDGDDWAPEPTAAAIVGAIRAAESRGHPFDLLLLGNESADTGDFQVGIRVAHALDLPCITGVKRLEIRARTVVAQRETATGWETYEVSLPAVVTVREGLNAPRHPSLRGTMAARKKPIDRSRPAREPAGLTPLRLRLPADQGASVEMLGEGLAAVPRIIATLKQLGALR